MTAKAGSARRVAALAVGTIAASTTVQPALAQEPSAETQSPSTSDELRALLATLPAEYQKNVTIDDNGWIRYAQRAPLPESTVYTIKGEVVDGDCHFQSTNGPAVSAGLVERSIALNPDTCKVVIERGLLTPELDAYSAGSKTAPAQVEAPAGSNTAPAQAQAPAAPNGDASVMGTCCFRSGNQTGGSNQPLDNYRWAQHRTWWEEPAQQSVGSIRVFVGWKSSSDCAGVDTSRHRVEWNWLANTGWSLHDDSWSHTNTCAGVSTIASARFSNGVFPACVGFDAHVHMSSTAISGQASGKYNMSWDSWLESERACIELLSWHRSHRYTEPFEV